MFERSLETASYTLRNNPSARQTRSKASFEAALSEYSKSTSNDGSMVAQASEPSHRQKHEACMSMLNEAHAAIQGLEIAIPRMSRGMIETLLRDPDNRALIEDRLDEADSKLEVVKNQCGDVLPKETMDGVADLQKRLKNIRNSIDGALRDPGGDAMKAVAGLAERAGKGLMILLGGLGFLFNLFRGPSYEGAQNNMRGPERG